MDVVDQQNVELATTAAVRAGQTQIKARVIALQVVAERLNMQAKIMTDAAEHAERDTYHRERRLAGEMILRARALLREALQIQEVNQ